MKTVVSISGGKSSSYIADNYPFDLAVFSLVRIEDERAAPKDPRLKIEAESRTGKPFVACAEPDNTMLAVLELEQRLGREIVWVTGPTFDALIKKRSNYLPNRVARYCTTELKIYPIFKYLYASGNIPCKMLIGFRAGEEGRAESVLKKLGSDGLEVSKMPVGYHPNGNNKWQKIAWRKPEFPLIKDRIRNDHVKAYWQGKGINFPLRNNCVGCFWRNPLLLAEMNKHEPNKFRWFAEQEGKGRWREDVSYSRIQKWKAQLSLDLEGFSDCDTGYCTA